MSKRTAEAVILEGLTCKGPSPKDDALRVLRTVIEAVRYRAGEGLDEANAATHYAEAERKGRHALNDILCILDAVEA